MPAKRCPMCHRASEATAWQCRCGYEFGQSVDKALVLLRDQQISTKILLGILLVADAAAVGSMVWAVLHGGIMIFGLALAMLSLWTARIARKLRITRESLRQLSARALPPAKVHKH